MKFGRLLAILALLSMLFLMGNAPAPYYACQGKAVGDACTGSNPRGITPVEMERLFRCIYTGDRVDF